MADYRTIADAEVDPDAPLTSSLGYAWRDNPIAITEGATGAPRITQAAILNPTAGNFRTITSVNVATIEMITAVTFSCITPGVVRINTNFTNVPGTVSVRRIRNGNDAVINQYTSPGNRNDDVTCNIGDVFYVTASGQPSNSAVGTVQVRVGNDAVGIVILRS